jgi:hypothetical protein
MSRRLIFGSLALPLGLITAAVSACATTAPDPVTPAPTTRDWLALAALPDWSGTWFPVISDQVAQLRTNPPPWKPAIRQQIDHWAEEEKAGRPRGILTDCLPHGVPTFYLITHNAIELLSTPGRVTILGESDGNRLVRIWTDGRKAPEDPDPSFHGYNIGHWEGDTLVVSTTAILSRTWLAVSEAVGVPIGEGASVIERIHLIGPDTLAFDLEITAPAVLSKPWLTRRLFTRKRTRSNEILEGVCRQGDFEETTDAWGNPAYRPSRQSADGNTLAPGQH